MSETKACPELAEAKAEIVYQAKLLIKLRRKIALFVHDMEDEGDRVYFGSTNDADDLRALYREFDEFEWSRMEKNRKGRDLFAELRSIRKKARELAEDRDRASDACATVQRERDALREELATALRLMHTARHIAIIAHGHWDSDEDSKVGKLLLALSGVLPKYRSDIDEIHAFLSRYEGEVK